MTKPVTVIVEGREYLVEVGDLNERPIKATVNEKTYEVHVPTKNGELTASPKARTSLPAAVSSPTPAAKATAPKAIGGLTIAAPMPGDIAEVKVKAGDSVQSGDVVCVLEAMKMKNLIHTSQAGLIATVDVVVGQTVDYGEVLVTLA